ncbi:hypothetical protein [Mycoplasma wenyonii]|nr:hypothetical protein [Mycoplasma wenyonii]
MWGLRGDVLGKVIAMIASGSGIGIGSLSELCGGGAKRVGL